jgi:hypothetical protein
MSPPRKHPDLHKISAYGLDFNNIIVFEYLLNEASRFGSEASISLSGSISQRHPEIVSIAGTKCFNGL